MLCSMFRSVYSLCLDLGLIEEDGDIRSCPDHIYSGQDDGDDGSIVVKDAIASCKQLIGSYLAVSFIACHLLSLSY